MIISKWKRAASEVLKNFLEGMGSIYLKNGVVIVGEWYDVDDPTITYLLLGYRDESHHKKFVSDMKKNEDYPRSYENVREHFQVKTLRMSPHVDVDLDELLLDNYIEDVKKYYNVSSDD